MCSEHRYQFTTQQVITDFSEVNIEEHYARGFLFTRLGKGVMQEVRSLRVELQKFELSSENRRVLKKSEPIACALERLPYHDYHWTIGKMAFDFYSTKFGVGSMSANKVKEMFTDQGKSNMNAVFVYRRNADQSRLKADSGGSEIGYCLVYQSKKMIHYAYPFYDLSAFVSVSNQRISAAMPLGIAMMTKAVVFAQQIGKQYLYLGSVQKPESVYKFQFKGLEWWDGEEWNPNISTLKEILSKE